jgi:beta-xylosidase
VGDKNLTGRKLLDMVNTENGQAVEQERIPLSSNTVYLKAACDFRKRADTARFYYSLDGKEWTAIGTSLLMPYTLPHFMGYRFGLYNYATSEAGGYVDFEYFNITNKL